jgi:hypothetical protein
MMAAGVFKRNNINKLEASLYRKIMMIGIDIPNTVIFNTMTSIRIAGDLILYLSKEPWNELLRHNRLTKFFEQIKDKEMANNTDGYRNNDVAMESTGGDDLN